MGKRRVWRFPHGIARRRLGVVCRACVRKKKAGPDLPVLAYANRATTGNRVRACFVGYGTAGCATPAGVPHARPYSFACTQKRGSSVDSRNPTGAERLISYSFGKSDTPWGYPTGCLRLSSFGTTIMRAPGAGRRLFASDDGYRNGSCPCAGTAPATSFRSRPARRAGLSLFRFWIRVAGSMHPVPR